MIDLIKEDNGTSTAMIYKIQENDRIDALTLGMLINNDIDNLVKVKAVQNDEQRQFVYDVTGMKSMRSYLGDEIRRDALLNVFLDIVKCLENTGKYMINPTTLFFDDHKIFVTEAGKVKMISMPVSDAVNDGNICNFFKQFMFKVSFDNEDGQEYIGKIISLLNPKTFSLDVFKNEINKILGRDDIKEEDCDFSSEIEEFVKAKEECSNVDVEEIRKTILEKERAPEEIIEELKEKATDELANIKTEIEKLKEEETKLDGEIAGINEEPDIISNEVADEGKDAANGEIVSEENDAKVEKDNVMSEEKSVKDDSAKEELVEEGLADKTEENKEDDTQNEVTDNEKHLSETEQTKAVEEEKKAGEKPKAESIDDIIARAQAVDFVKKMKEREAREKALKEAQKDTCEEENKKNEEPVNQEKFAEDDKQEGSDLSEPEGNSNSESDADNTSVENDETVVNLSGEGMQKSEVEEEEKSEEKPDSKTEEKTEEKSDNKTEEKTDSKTEEESEEDVNGENTAEEIEQTEEKKVAVLTRMKDGRKLKIDKDKFYVGSDGIKVDYCIDDNSAISKEHAYFEKDGDVYLLFDNYSENRTFVNNIPLSPEMEMLLDDGMIIKFADEEFKFSIEVENE